MESDKIEKLWRSRETILEILEDRKYDVDPSLHLELEEFVDWVGEDDEKDVKDAMALEMERSSGAKTPETIMVVWWPVPKLATDINNIYRDMVDRSINNAIIVVDESTTPYCAAVVKRLRTSKMFIDIYTLSQTQINITKHVLVPKHEICSTAEKKKLMKEYSLTPDKIPHIKMADPVVKHLGAKREQLLRITRESDTQPGNFAVTYRLVM